MDASIYQKLAARTLIDEPGFEISGKDMMLVWCAIGAAGEAGELANIVKKAVLHRHGFDTLDQLAEEIGDVVWYLAGLCTVLGIDLSGILIENIAKLDYRYPNGFSTTDSINRDK